MTPGTVLVPLDGTRHSLAALPVAGELARVLDATPHVLNVSERPRSGPELLGELGLTASGFRGSVLDQMSGPADQSIVHAAEDLTSAVIVMCTHTGASKPSGGLGSVAEAVLCHTSTPIVLVQPQRGRVPWSLRRILLPHDGTPTTAAAMDPVGGLAHRSGAEVLVLHVAEPGAPRPDEPGSLAIPRYVDQPQHEWPAWSEEFIERMTALGHPPEAVRFKLRIAAGEPGEEIVAFAVREAADLTALAWRGDWSSERAPTLKKVIRDAGSPVLVLRAETPEGKGISTTGEAAWLVSERRPESP